MTEGAGPQTDRRRRPPRAVRAGPYRITVLLVDDHTVVRQGFKVLLDGQPDIHIVGESADGRSAAAFVRRRHPDVVVMDIAMPRLNGLEASRRILDDAPGTRVLILSAHGDAEYVQRARELGASGFLLKDSSCNDLATAIRTVWSGRPYFLRASAAHPTLLDSHTREALADPAPELLRALTPRESEVLQLVAEGWANKESAVHLGISIKTVEKHRSNLMRKLDIHDVAGLTRFAIAAGVIEGRKRWVFD